MKANIFRKKFHGFFSFLALFALLNLSAGCNNSSSNNTFDNPVYGSISGTVTGVNPEGAVAFLLDSSGKELAESNIPLQEDGSYHLELKSPVAATDYLIVRVTRNDRILRALVTGFFGQDNYAEEDVMVTPDTEAAVLLCSLGQSVSLYDYALFLRGSTNGIFDPNSPDSYGFPYRELIGELSEKVAAYFDGTADALPDRAQIAQMIITSNHLLGASIPSDILSHSEVQRAISTTDGNAQLILGYDANGSTVSTAAPVQVTASSHQDGSFRWNAYRVDLGDNVLKSAHVRVIEKNPAGATTVLNLAASGTEPRLLSTDTSLDEVSGTITVATSNTGALIDPDSSGLAVQANNVNAPFVTTFNQEIHSAGVVINLGLQPIGGKTTPLETIPVTSGKTFTSNVISLTEAAHQNKLVIASIVSGSTVLYALEDFIDLTRYQTQAPMLTHYSLSQTRASSDDIYNNFMNSHDVNLQPVDVGNVYSHYILDLDLLLQSKAISGWNKTAYGSNPPGDGHGRIPLIFVHGWQGHVGYRSAARLSDWTQSPVLYIYDFISYYMGTPELNQKYHIYLMRWPSYKHIDYSGNLFSSMLHDVQAKHPETDLGIGMTDPGTGVVVMTHSTGGLITRNAIETHLAFAGAGADYTFLRKAILLASPNHGTPEAVNTWPNNWSDLTGMDVGTQATADLEWDSFDDKSNLYFSLGALLVGHFLSYQKDRSGSRWVADGENVGEFDLHYLNVLENMNAATYNPWLLWFTRNFADLKEDLSSKYILYSGWTRIITDPGNFVFNSPAMGFAQTTISMAGYHSDSVLPVCSNLMATSADQKGFYLHAPDPTLSIQQDWYPQSTLYGFEDTNTGEDTGEDWNVIVIGNANDHPLGMAFRLIWDFDHTQTYAGALSGISTDNINKLIDLPMNTDVVVNDNFLTSEFRRGYLRGAVTYNTGSTPSDETLDAMTNRLKADPLFLILEKDLLNVAKQQP